MCTFSTFNSLKVHLSRIHSEKRVAGGDSHDLTINRAFHCPVCDFKQPFVERDMYGHLRQHMQRTFALRREEIVNSAPPIAELKDRWPALFCEAQVSKNLKRAFKKLTRHILSKSSL